MKLCLCVCLLLTTCRAKRSCFWSSVATEATLWGSSVFEPWCTPSVYTGGYHMANKTYLESAGMYQYLFPPAVITLYDITGVSNLCKTHKCTFCISSENWSFSVSDITQRREQHGEMNQERETSRGAFWPGSRGVMVGLAVSAECEYYSIRPTVHTFMHMNLYLEPLLT